MPWVSVWDFSNVVYFAAEAAAVVVARSIASPSRQWTNLRALPRTLTCAMLCNKLTANMSHKHWNDWGSPISATTQCAWGCPTHPYRESTECALEGWPSAVGGRHR
jgi:hypothetical protein